MELENAKRIGYHLAGESKVADPESHLPWAFAHALGDLPGPSGKLGYLARKGLAQGVLPGRQWRGRGNIQRVR